jgi:hypothetical protein
MHILKALEKQDHEFLKEGGVKGPLDDHLYMHHMPYSYTAEQIRKLRTYIFHMPENRPVPRVIMVTSALPGKARALWRRTWPLQLPREKTSRSCSWTVT